MINFKKLFIISLFYTATWSALSDVQLIKWTDLQPNQCTQLEMFFNHGDSDLKITEGKYLQSENEMKYLLIFSRPEKTDCLHSFMYKSADKTSPFTTLNFDQNTVTSLLQSVSGLKLCDQEDLNDIFKIPMAKLNGTIDHLIIPKEQIVKTMVNLMKPGINQMLSKHGSWTQMNEDDVSSISKNLAMDENNLVIVDGLMQVVSGINYALAVQSTEDESDPCVITFNLRLWDASNKVSVLDSSVKESGFSGTNLDQYQLCEDEVETNLVETSNQKLLSSIKSQKINDLQVGSWNGVNEKASQTIEKYMNFKKFGISFDKAPSIQKQLSVRYAMSIKDTQGGKCYMILTMVKKREIVKLEIVEDNEGLKKIGNYLYGSILPCPKSFLASIISEMNVKEAYIGLLRTELSEIENQYPQIIKNIEGDWRVMTDQNIISARTNLKTNGKSYQPISGLMNLNHESYYEYIFLMNDQYNIPCSIYFNFTSNSSKNVFTVKNVTDIEGLHSGINNVDPCEEDVFEEYQNSIRILI
jgi:hypothetical protein